ncbi:hypothetical protein JCM10450v2_007211 [Rhodotorula kratochvilovae]
MTRPTLRLLLPLRLSSSGRWVPSRRPLNLDRHPPPPKHRLGHGARFDTLASDTTGVASLQAVPPSSADAGADECCMSGCAICVYDLYLEDLENFHSSVSAARSAVLDQLREGARLDEGDWPPELLGPWEDAEKELKGVKDGASGEEREQAAREQAERELKRARDALDPSMRAFLEMEARMKAKQREKTAPSSPAPGSSSLSSAPP